MNTGKTVLKRKKLAIWVGLMAACQTAAAESLAVQDNPELEGSNRETITVVGEKQSRSLQDTQSSVSVTTAADIEDKGYYSIKDVYSDVAGIYPDAGGLGFAVRGIPFEGLGGNQSSSDVVTVYIDGVPQTNSAVNFRPMQLWDVEQIEIYRGAQSTIQGRNALAGAVIINTQKPTYENSGKVRLTAGDYNTQGASVAFGGAIVNDVVAWRVSHDYLSSDGYIENETLDEDANKTEFNNFNAKLLVEPSDSTEILLIGNYSKSRHGELSNDTVEGDAFDFDLYQNVDTFRENEVGSFAVHVNHDISDSLKFTSISTLSMTDDESLLDFDQKETTSLAGELRDDTIGVDRDTDVVTQELRISYDNQNNLKGHAGIYYYRSQQDATRTTSLTAADTVDPAIEGLYADGFRFGTATTSEVEIENYAFFGEVEWNVNNNWTLIAGARQDYETNDSESQTSAAAETSFVSSPFHDPVNAILQAGLAGQASPLSTTDTTYRAFLPKLGVVHAFSDELSLGFTAQKAYRAGGATINLVTSEVVEFDPEYTNNYELSFRSQWPELGLTFNSNIYYIDWTDQQVTVYSDPSNTNSGQIENAGESHLRGIELTVNYAINQQWEVYTSTAFSDTEYDEFESTTSDLSGEEIQGAPNTIANVGVSYNNSGLGVDLRTRYQSESVSQYEVDGDGNVTGERKNDSFTTVDLTVSYSYSDWLITAQLNNAFNREYITNNQNDSFVDVGAPRTLLTSVQFEY